MGSARRLACALVVGATAAALLAPAGAGAVRATPGATVVSPEPDGVYTTPWSGPVVVDFSDQPAGTYEVVVGCPAQDFTWTQEVVHDGTTPSYTWTLPDPVTEPTPCEVTVPTADGGTTTTSFQLVTLPPPVEISLLDDLRLSSPVLRPGDRDPGPSWVRLRFTLNRHAHLHGRVLDRRGHLVKQVDLGRSRVGAHAWGWLGRDAQGHYVDAGRYQMRVVAERPGGFRTSAGRSLVVRR